ncbi:MAG TPA: DUF1028 domain-containing protein [Xanthobacteraceae bacterium]|jgi:uncharacterized Ntn-hydrolase superfamily protein
MTWSIIARDRDSAQLGIAVASRFFAVGAVVPHVRSHAGAIATQALVNSFYGTEGLRLLQEGRSSPDVVSAVTTADPGREHRQVHAMDLHGRIGAHTGRECIRWCGHLAATDFSVAGNMLAGAGVLETTAEVYERNAGLPFPRRLIAAMRAGEAAGGDKRGRQSAALVLCGEQDWPDLDLRVDDHADPLAELERLERVSRELFVPFRRLVPNRRDRVGLTDHKAIESETARAAAAEGPA